jgi:hypothetical protein
VGFHEASGEALHRFCARHISENVKKHYGKVCSELFEGCAYTKNCARFDHALELIKKENAEAWEYVKHIGCTPEEIRQKRFRLDKWAASHDGGRNRWGILTTNGVESINKVYKDARALPVTALVEETFCKTMRWFADRREAAREIRDEGHRWAPVIAQKIARRDSKSKPHKVKVIHHQQCIYHVSGKEGKPGQQVRFKYRVQIYPEENRASCECQKPDLTGVPCAHVIAVLAHKHWNTNDFVSDYYSAQSLYRTWEQTLEPFGTVDAYPQLNVPKYVPDRRKILRGRRKHHRMPMTMDEMGREGKKKHSYRCTRCGGQGHTKRTCRVPYEQAEGSRRRHSTSGPPSNAHMLNEFLPGKS